MNTQPTPSERIKQSFWRMMYPIFPRMQNHFLKWHIVWHERGRQPYHLGYLAPGRTLRQLQTHLHEVWGFGNHFIAWTDNEQVLSWRKLVSFEHQYHLRVFSDGEIRGHYEYTPEARPVAHFTEVAEEARREQFRKFLAEFLVEKKHAVHLEPDLNYMPQSEITIDDSRGR